MKKVNPDTYKEKIQTGLIIAIFAIFLILISWWETCPITFSEWYRICNSYTNDCMKFYWQNKIYYQNIAKISLLVFVVDSIVLIYFLFKRRRVIIK